MRISDLLGQDVALLGAGREGQAVARALRALAPRHPLTWYSEAPVEDFHAAACDTLVIGPFDGARLAAHDVLVRSPGVSPYRAAITQATDAGVAMTTGTNLWLAEHPHARTLVVTGTKGKSTTAALLAHLLRAGGHRVGLAGNIGVPLLDCDASAADWWVLELSSYQLCDLEESVWLGLVTNLSDEHLDWHGGAARYRADKLRLAQLAPPDRFLANGADGELRGLLADRVGTTWFNVTDGRRGVQVRAGELHLDGHPIAGASTLPGAHNLENQAAALAVLNHIGALPDDLATALESFEGLPHRLHEIGSRGELRFVDDSLSTTPVATLAALEALQGAPITVLIGGFDRGLDWEALAPDFARTPPHAVIGMPDSGARLLRELASGGLAPEAGFHLAEDLDHAVALAKAQTPSGGVVLLSPGAPSFPRFRDFQERGECFARLALAP